MILQALGAVLAFIGAALALQPVATAIIQAMSTRVPVYMPNGFLWWLAATTDVTGVALILVGLLALYVGYRQIARMKHSDTE